MPGCEEPLRVRDVVPDPTDALGDLVACLRERLAHLCGRCRGEVVLVASEHGREPCEGCRPLLERGGPPAEVGGMRGVEQPFDLRAGVARMGRQRTAVRRIDRGVVDRGVVHGRRCSVARPDVGAGNLPGWPSRQVRLPACQLL